MPEVKWIKLSTSMFEDEKIRLIESLPEADSILVIWVKLLAQAGKTNASGYIFLNENIPFTDEMLATLFNRPLPVIRLALRTFQDFGMIEISSDHIISISNWEKHQNLEGLEKIREQNRLRKQKQRAKSLLVLPENKESNTVSRDVTGQVTPSHATDIDKDIDIDKELNNKKSRKQIYDESSIYFQLANLLYQRILENNPNHKKTNLQNWASQIRLMMEKDKRTEEQIRFLIDWSQNDSFWMGNILSTKKLREKFDALVIQIKARKNKTAYAKPQVSLFEQSEESKRRQAAAEASMTDERWEETKKKVEEMPY